MESFMIATEVSRKMEIAMPATAKNVRLFWRRKSANAYLNTFTTHYPLRFGSLQNATRPSALVGVTSGYYTFRNNVSVGNRAGLPYRSGGTCCGGRVYPRHTWGRSTGMQDSRMYCRISCSAG